MRRDSANAMTTGTRSNPSVVICASGVGLRRRAGASRLLRAPILQCAMRVARIAVHGVVADDLRCELETHAVGIEEVDRLDELVIGDADDLDAVGLEPHLHR